MRNRIVRTVDTHKHLYGGTGSSENVVINIGDVDYEVHSAYSTNSNGYADAIVVPAGSYAMCINRGGPSDFAHWIVARNFDTLVEDIRRYEALFAQGVSIHLQRLMSQEDLRCMFPPKDRMGGLSLTSAAVKLYRSLHR